MVMLTTWGKALQAQETVQQREAELAAARSRRDLLVRRLAREGHTQTEIANELGMTRQNVALIIRPAPK
jgi:transcriptional regulator